MAAGHQHLGEARQVAHVSHPAWEPDEAVEVTSQAHGVFTSNIDRVLQVPGHVGEFTTAEVHRPEEDSHHPIPVGDAAQRVIGEVPPHPCGAMDAGVRTENPRLLLEEERLEQLG